MLASGHMRYRVSMSEPHSHLFEIEAVLEAPGASPVLALPVWTPGSYLVREFARHLERIEADDGSGRKLPVLRLDKHRFRVDAGDSAQVRVRYRVYANDPTVRTSHLDGAHGFFNGANLFLYAEGRVEEPVGAGHRPAGRVEGVHGAGRRPPPLHGS